MKKKNIINILPNSSESEQALLGSILIENSNWENISDIIDEHDFYQERNRIIFSSISSLIKNGLPADVITVIDLIKKENKMEKVGGEKYLNFLIQHSYSSQNIIAYANIIRDNSLLRKLAMVSKKIIEISINHKNNKISDILDTAEEKILSISDKYNKKKHENLYEISKILTYTIKKIELLFELKAKITGLSSGFDELDKLILGLHPSELIIIAGRPSTGKTTLAINIAENIIIKYDVPVLIFSMEMSAEQITTRLLSSLSKIELSKLRNGNLTDSDWQKLSSSVELISGKKFFIDDSANLSPFDVKSKSRKIFQKHKNIGAIIIDYIQLMRIPGSNDNKTNEIAEISRSLKILAKELNVPIIALSQLNRGLEQRIDKRPMMSDLRESGAIEQDADVIIFIYRDELYNKNSKDIGLAEIIISKQRNGPTGNFKLVFLGKFSKFENLN